MLVISAALVHAAPLSAHEQTPFDPRRVTPGLGVELIEVTSAADAAAPAYRIRAVGFPRDVEFRVWTRDFGRGFHELSSRVRLDDSGIVTSGEPSGAGAAHPLEAIIVGPGPYPRGAVWDVAIVSADFTRVAVARITPRPLTARDGRCTVVLELVSRRGERFLASGEGFLPGEEVTIESRSAGRIVRKRQRVSAEGRLPADVVAHGTVGSEHGGRYTVTSRSCEVAIDYDWGDAAIIRGPARTP